MNALSDWTEDRAEAERWLRALRRTVKYAFRPMRIARHDGPYGRTYYRVEG